MSTHVVGIVPPDDIFRKMKSAYESCYAAGLRPPKEVLDFFKGETPDDKGVVIDLGSKDGVTEYVDADKTAQGFEVDITKLPKHVKIVRFANSW